mmetsp:Transcript_145879/g.467572  ORF Transcript_145879/g.467572 Transcript_145879/m.467572 type:complete len:214 (+) Transcript_145879:582-1223(+)
MKEICGLPRRNIFHQGILAQKLKHRLQAHHLVLLEVIEVTEHVRNGFCKGALVLTEVAFGAESVPDSEQRCKWVATSRSTVAQRCESFARPKQEFADFLASPASQTGPLRTQQDGPTLGQAGRRPNVRFAWSNLQRPIRQVAWLDFHRLFRVLEANCKFLRRAIPSERLSEAPIELWMRLVSKHNHEITRCEGCHSWGPFHGKMINRKTRKMR